MKTTDSLSFVVEVRVFLTKRSRPELEGVRPGFARPGFFSRRIAPYRLRSAPSLHTCQRCTRWQQGFLFQNFKLKRQPHSRRY